LQAVQTVTATTACLLGTAAGMVRCITTAADSSGSRQCNSFHPSSQNTCSCVHCRIADVGGT
jgi:hypothetical protein